MKARLLCQAFFASKVFKGLVLVGLYVTGLAAVFMVIGFVKRTWYRPRRSVQVLRRLNEKAQSLDEQIEIILEAMSLDHRNFDARFWYARKLVEKERYSEAVHAWHSVRNHRHCPSGIFDTAFADQGICLLFADRPAEAIVYLEETIRRRPGHVSSRGFLAAAYADLGLSHRVEEELVKLANLKPGWQQQFATCPEYLEEHRIALTKLKPYLEDAGEGID